MLLPLGLVIGGLVSLYNWQTGEVARNDVQQQCEDQWWDREPQIPGVEYQTQDEYVDEMCASSLVKG